MKEFKPNKSKMKDVMGRYMTQSLFLEVDYNPDIAIFTFDGEDKEFKGKTFYSLKRLYLEESDPIEYAFATKYLFDWPHWQKICKNAMLLEHINAWREELQLKLASEGMATLQHLAINEDSYQAAKYLADKGFVKNGRGRPSNAEIEGALKKHTEDSKDFDNDFQLLEFHKGKPHGKTA